MPTADWKNDDYQSQGFETLPAGTYLCVVDTSEEKKTKDGKGRYWEFTFLIAKGQYKGRKFWSRLNVHNPSEVAQRIGREQWFALCTACGVPDTRASEKTHGKAVVCIVEVEPVMDQTTKKQKLDPATGEPKTTNRITGYLKPPSSAQGTEKPAASEPDKKKEPAFEGADKPSLDLEDDDIPF